MPGDVTLLEPGRDAPVTLVADGTGNVPQYGELVGIVGESDRGTHVSYPSAAGSAIGHLVGFPADVDPDGTFEADEVVGEAMIKLRSAVDWFPLADAYDPTVDDLVVGQTDGTVDAYDNAGGDTPDMIIGRVFTTIARTEGVADKAAVIRR